MTTQARVLVVDDDPVVAKSIDRVLTGKGYAVITASDGPEALAKLAAEKYDAVYTDIRMPGMDGLQVAARIKATQPWLPVVIVTGYGTPLSETLAREIGVNGFLHKPLSPEMIEASAREVLQASAEDTLPPPVAAPAAAAAMPAAVPAGLPAAVSTVKNVALFVAAPFIGLAYALAFPFVGLFLLARFGLRALADKARAR
jgi:CheY-like chemotaxis protein